MAKQRTARKFQHRWSYRTRLLASIPVFLVLIGILTFASSLSAVPWSDQPMNRTIQTMTSNTAVDMVPTASSLQCDQNESPTDQNGLCAVSLSAGAYKVATRMLSFEATESGTHDTQLIHLLLHYPVGDHGSMPGIIFISGAGTGSATDAYQDQADYFASAGFMAATVDKPVWNTTAISRNYPAMAKVYDHAIQLMSEQPGVDANKIGIHIDSESGWIDPYMQDFDHKIAFQILASPMLFEPREAAAFFVAQDFSITGANPGYQAMVRKVFSANFDMFGLTNANINPFNNRTFSIPTFLAYGSRDVLTSQVDGMMKIMEMAQKSGNENFVLRDYSFADHILRLGDAAAGDTILADHYLQEALEWSAGIVKGYKQTAPKVAGHDVYQSIGLPKIHATKAGTLYFVILHCLLLLMILVSLAFSVIVLVKKIVALVKHRNTPVAFASGFGKVMLFMILVTVFAFLLFIAAVAQIIWRVSCLGWGAAPIQPAGMIYWSWYVVQIACAIVVWTWARVLVNLIEAGADRGWFHWFKRLAREPVEPVAKGRQEPFFATTRLGLAYFIVLTATMLLILLFFAFWGLFQY
ncbi:MAG: alpha/beta hydrolase [Aeriscardovia sp.]|nr:alpha/beta hydrolase [Aeriscardovia sp.]